MVGGRHLCILYHCLQCKLVVDTVESACHSIGNNNFAMTTSLRASVAVAASRIGHVALVLIYIKEGVHYVTLYLRIVYAEQRGRRAIGVPDGIVVVIVWRVCPLRVLASLVDRHEHDVIKCGIEHSHILLRALIFQP